MKYFISKNEKEEMLVKIKQNIFNSIR